jgi:hypothetical protein
MNTPEPCGSCGFLYVDCMTEGDDDSSAECIKDLQIGNINCIGYKNYKMVSFEEKWNTMEKS